MGGLLCRGGCGQLGRVGLGMLKCRKYFALRSTEESIVTEGNVLFVEEHAFSVL